MTDIGRNRNGSGNTGSGALDQSLSRHWPKAKVQCPVCLNDTDDFSKTDGCGHVFCHDCLRTWAGRSRTCPMCRQGFARIFRRRPMGRIESRASDQSSRRAPVVAERIREGGEDGPRPSADNDDDDFAGGNFTYEGDDYYHYSRASNHGGIATMIMMMLGILAMIVFLLIAGITVAIRWRRDLH